MDDLDKVVAQGNAGSEGLDYAGIFGGRSTTEEVERRVSGKTVPSFPLYVVHFGGAKAGFSKKKGTPFFRPWAIIKNGPDGTVGELASDDFYVSVSKTYEDDDGIVRRKSQDKFNEDADALVAKLNRIARVGGFEVAHPAGFDQNALDAYAAQFAGPGDKGFDAIVEIREVTEEYDGVKRTKNRIVWESLARLDDPADAKKLRAAGKTALEEALLKITERNESERKRSSGTKAGSAGATSRTSPEALFS